MKRRAFTLIELLTVIAISSVLLAIILIPLVQSFNFTRTAQAFVDSQERARRLIADVSEEIANASGVRENDGDKGSVAVVVPGQDGTDETVLLRYAKVDIVKPALGDPSQRRDGAYVDPDTGRADPTLKAPKGQPIMPGAPGMTIVRYFIGLYRPLATNNLDPERYLNPYDGLLMPRGGGDENLYVLYRIEFQPYIFDGTTLAVNTDLLTDADANGAPDDLDDPYFFVQDPPGQPVLPPVERQQKADRIANWRRQAKVVTALSRYDMVVPVHNRQSGEVTYDGNVPRITALAQFRPTAVANAPAEPQTVLRLGEESDAPESLQADVFHTDHGAWSSAIIRVFPEGYAAASPTDNAYLVGRLDPEANDRRLRLYRYDPDNDDDGDDRNGEGPDGTDDLEVFDAKAYDDAITAGSSYPFTRAMDAADTRSGWLGDANARALFCPFTVDARSGKVLFSFGIDQVGDTNVPMSANNNLPYLDAGPELTPVSDSGLTGNFYDPAFGSINRYFNKIWFDMQNGALPDLRPDVHRFIDLRVTPNEDGTPSPLDPDSTVGFSRGFIVPGSEVVYGPDQNPGPNYGEPIRYTRVTRSPGINQYRLNYTDQEEPDYTLLGVPAPPVSYSSTDFTSAVIQPRYKAGYLQLNSDPNTPLPDAAIRVYYKFQMIGAGDTVTVDYDTREAIQIMLSLRNYPRTSLGAPQIVTLQGSATVRNFLK